MTYKYDVVSSFFIEDDFVLKYKQYETQQPVSEVSIFFLFLLDFIDLDIQEEYGILQEDFISFLENRFNNDTLSAEDIKKLMDTYFRVRIVSSDNISVKRIDVSEYIENVVEKTDFNNTVFIYYPSKKSLGRDFYNESDFRVYYDSFPPFEVIHGNVVILMSCRLGKSIRNYIKNLTFSSFKEIVLDPMLKPDSEYANEYLEYDADVKLENFTDLLNVIISAMYDIKSDLRFIYLQDFFGKITALISESYRDNYIKEILDIMTGKVKSPEELLFLPKNLDLEYYYEFIENLKKGIYDYEFDHILSVDSLRIFSDLNNDYNLLKSFGVIPNDLSIESIIETFMILNMYRFNFNPLRPYFHMIIRMSDNFIKHEDITELTSKVNIMCTKIALY